MAVFCNNCGKQATGSERFCTGCGAQLPAAQQQGYPQQQGYQPANYWQQAAETPAKPKMEKKKLYTIIGAAVAVIAVAVVLILVLGGGSKEVSKKNVEGKWKVTDVSGSGNASDFSTALSMGVEVYMVFDNGTLKVEYSYLGQSDSQSLGSYEIKDGKITINGQEAECTISGDEMTLKDSTTTMKMKKQ